MTNKRKIQILKKVIKRFEKIIPKFNKDEKAYRHLYGVCGICNQIYCVYMTYHEQRKVHDKDDMDGFIKKEFKLTMPQDKGSVYRWSLTAKGYQARINACKKAIERLSK